MISFWKIVGLANVVLWLPLTVSADTFTVDTVADANLSACTSSPNDCSLRGAINRANARPGDDTVSFYIPGAGVKKIAPATPLPILTDAGTFIDGSRQIGPGASPLIELSSENIAANALANGLTIQTSFCIVRKINLHGWFRGILISGTNAHSNAIQGCYIGTDPTGLLVPAAKNVIGIHLTDGATSNTIGGDATQRNIIAGNSGTNNLGLPNSGIYVSPGSAAGTYVEANFINGNYIGTNRNGSALGDEDQRNGYGVFVNGSSRISLYGNLISGNRLAGIRLNEAQQNRIHRNIIGLATDGTALGNGTYGDGFGGDGIQITSEGNTVAEQSSSNIIGRGVQNRNIISGHRGNGIELSGSGVRDNFIETNFIGTDTTGKFARGNVYGVLVNRGASDNVIGDIYNTGHNIISGNDIGVSIQDFDSVYNTVQSNYIGTDISGTQAIPNFVGVEVQFASQNGIGPFDGGSRNVISGNRVYNVRVAHFPGAGATSITSNFIGTTAQGDKALGNYTVIAGIYLQSSSGNNIGFTTTDSRNVVSGNAGYGILVSGGQGNSIQGNFIGTDAKGQSRVSNGKDGIFLESSPQNTIGGPGAARNLISGNAGNGITISGVGSDNNRVQNNYIGLNLTGAAPLSNRGRGVFISGGAKNNLIGGVRANERNVISGNLTGVLLQDLGTTNNTVSGNYIGTNAPGTAAIGNAQGGVVLTNAPNNFIGLATGRNLISGNGSGGVILNGANGRFNQVQGNFIGTSAAGDSIISNVRAGVVIGSPDNLIGGLTATAGQGAGNVISGHSTGIIMQNPGATRTRVQGNLIGTDATGTKSLPNRENGIEISLGASNNLIGGNTPQARNVISTNTSGHGAEISMKGSGVSGNRVQGNYLGLDISGTKILRQNTTGPSFGGSGVVISAGAHDNLLGGSQAGEGNVISTTYINVSITGAGSARNIVQGNYLGTDAKGLPLSGGAVYAVELNSGASDNLIGGATAGARNVVVASGDGVHISDYGNLGTKNNRIQGNFIGLPSGGSGSVQQPSHGILIGGFGAPANNIIGGVGAGEGNVITLANCGVRVQRGVGNTIRGNSIYNNESYGIDLGTDGVTPNDPGDADTGANNLQNFPVLQSATTASGTLTIKGILNSTPNRTFVIDLYANDTADSSGHGEGHIRLGSFEVSSGSGVVTFQQSVAFSDDYFQEGFTIISATATDLSTGDTSEFSKWIEVNASAPAAITATTAIVATAYASNASVVLQFTEKLQKAEVKDISTKINGQNVTVQSVEINDNTLTVLLPQNSLQAGDEVDISWDGLITSQEELLKGHLSKLIAE